LLPATAAGAAELAFDPNLARDDPANNGDFVDLG